MIHFCGASDIAVVSMAIGENYQELVAAGTKNKQAYCTLHGYDFINLTTNLDESRPVAWNKILILQKALKNQKYRWLFWMDADAIFMNFATKLEELIDERYALIVGSDLVGCNTGNFFLKSCDWSDQFLQTVYAHQEFIHHRYWEQAAIMKELKTNRRVQQMTKVLAPRLLNAYPFPLHGAAEVYQKGDFLLHFATIGGQKLKELLGDYTAKTTYDASWLDLEAYLDIHGLTLSANENLSVNEGVLTAVQKSQIHHQLQQMPFSMKRIAVIGFSAGHSAELFYHFLKEVELTACDLNLNSFTAIGVDFMQRKYPKRFTFVEGDAEEMAKKNQLLNLGQPFDLIYFNGDHSYESRKKDLLQAQAMATAQTALWINTYYGEMKRSVDYLVKVGILEIDQLIENPEELCHQWVVAHYLFPEKTT